MARLAVLSHMSSQMGEREVQLRSFDGELAAFDFPSIDSGRPPMR